MKLKMIAAISDYVVAYANPNDAATLVLDPAIRNNSGIYPDADTMANLYTLPGSAASAKPNDNPKWEPD